MFDGIHTRCLKQHTTPTNPSPFSLRGDIEHFLTIKIALWWIRNSLFFIFCLLSRFASLALDWWPMLEDSMIFCLVGLRVLTNWFVFLLYLMFCFWSQTLEYFLIKSLFLYDKYSYKSLKHGACGATLIFLKKFYIKNYFYWFLRINYILIHTFCNLGWKQNGGGPKSAPYTPSSTKIHRPHYPTHTPFIILLPTLSNKQATPSKGLSV